MWDEVQSINLMKYDPATRKTPEPSLFSGMLVCADCGGSMICNTETHRRNGQQFVYHSYLCSTRKRTGDQCSCHTIYEKTLLRIIREELLAQLQQITINEERVVNEIQSRLSSVALDETKKALQGLSVRIEELDANGARLYEDRLKGKINLDTFMALSSKMETERAEVEAESERLSATLETAERQVTDINRWINSIRSYLALSEPDSVTLRELIDKIEIGELEGRGKARQQSVKIIYRFVGVLG